VSFPQRISDLQYQWALGCRAFERCRSAEEDGSDGDWIDAHLDAFACVHALWSTFERLDPTQKAAVRAADTGGFIDVLANVANGFKHPGLSRHAVADPGGGHGVTIRLGAGVRGSYHPHYDLHGTHVLSLDLTRNVVDLLVENAGLPFPADFMPD